VDLGAFALILAGVLLSLLTKKAETNLPAIVAPPPPAPALEPPAAVAAMAAWGATARGGHRLMLELPKLGSGGGVELFADGAAEPAPAAGGRAGPGASSSSKEAAPADDGAAPHGSAAGAQGGIPHRGPEPLADAVGAGHEYLGTPE
jgi:hypothetical protein